MSDIIIKTEEGKKEKPAEVADIKETLKQADEYERLKVETEKLETMFLRNQEIKAKLALGGKAEAGQAEKSPEDVAKDEALKLVSQFR